MDQSKRELQVGITVLLSTIVLIAGFLWFERVRLTGGTDIYLADFPEVAGLQVGDRVQVRGIRMGTVTEFNMVDDLVRVELQLEQGADLREDAEIKLGTKGIVGEVLIEIDPGTGASVMPGYVFQGRPAMSLDAVTESVSSTLKSIQSLTAETRDFFARVWDEGQIVETLGEAREAVYGINALVNENRREVGALLDETTASVAALRVILEDSALTRTLRGSSVAVERADTLLTRVNTLSVRLDSLLAMVEGGEGTVGHLFHDESLYVSADSALTSLNRLLRELRRNPKKYFKLSVLDF
jgi:phospholipid/cholesterol/gamma-HCH transport system substrate-binding protein